MQKKKILFFIVIFLFNFSSFWIVVKADTLIIYAEKDAYVDSRYPNDNFGGEEYMICVNDTYSAAAYIYFDIHSVPKGGTWAYLYLTYFTNVLGYHLRVVNTTDNWDEDLITWNNKPSLGDSLYGLIPGSACLDGCTLDRRFLAKDISGNNFSICIYSYEIQNGSVLISSREALQKDLRPRLKFEGISYDINFTPIILGVSISIISIVIFIGGLSYMRKRKLRRKVRELLNI